MERSETMRLTNQEINYLLDVVEKNMTPFGDTSTEEAKQAKEKLEQIRTEGLVPSELEPRFLSLSLQSAIADFP